MGPHAGVDPVREVFVHDDLPGTEDGVVSHRGDGPWPDHGVDQQADVVEGRALGDLDVEVRGERELVIARLPTGLRPVDQGRNLALGDPLGDLDVEFRCVPDLGLAGGCLGILNPACH